MTGLIAEHDISIGGRLRMKLLIFDSRKSLRESWNAIMPNKICRRTLGAVNGLGYEVATFENGKQDKIRMEVDPRYFCVMALDVTELCFEVVAHESTHAGFCYAKRTRGRNMWASAFDFDEEHVCYPAGRIASEVNRFCHQRDLYRLSKRLAQT